MSKAFLICNERAPSADGAARLLFVRRSHFSRTANKRLQKNLQKSLQHQRCNVFILFDSLNYNRVTGRGSRFMGTGVAGCFTKRILTGLQNTKFNGSHLDPHREAV